MTRDRDSSGDPIRSKADRIRRLRKRLDDVQTDTVANAQLISVIKGLFDLAGGRTVIEVFTLLIRDKLFPST